MDGRGGQSGKPNSFINSSCGIQAKLQTKTKQSFLGRTLLTLILHTSRYTWSDRLSDIRQHPTLNNDLKFNWTLKIITTELETNTIHLGTHQVTLKLLYHDPLNIHHRLPHYPVTITYNILYRPRTATWLTSTIWITVTFGLLQK